MIKLKDMLMEMPLLCKSLDKVDLHDLEQLLRPKVIKFGQSNNVEAYSIGNPYYIVDGINVICADDKGNPILYDKFGMIIKKTDTGYDLCLGAMFKRALTSISKTGFQVGLVKKFGSDPKDAASLLYIYLCKKWGHAIFSDSRMTAAGSHLWDKILNRKDLSKEGIRPFVYDIKNKKELPNTGDINDFVSQDSKFENIIFGIIPISNLKV